jgi:hypothetical protein
MKREERTWAGRVYRTLHPAGGGFERWLEYVQEIEVKLHPGGRASLIHPRTKVPVEIRWTVGAADRRTGQWPTHTDRQHFVLAVDISLLRIEPRRGQRPEWEDITPERYIAALGLKLAHGGLHDLIEKGEAPRLIVPKPAAGRRPSIGYYSHLLLEYEQLLRAGSKSPVSELAYKRDMKPATLKSQLSRGRTYVRGAKP